MNRVTMRRPETPQGYCILYVYSHTYKILAINCILDFQCCTETALTENRVTMRHPETPHGYCILYVYSHTYKISVINCII